MNVRPSRHKTTEEAADELGLAREAGPRLPGRAAPPGPGLDKGLSGDTSGNRTDKCLKCYLYLDFHPLAPGTELTREFKEGTT